MKNKQKSKRKFIIVFLDILIILCLIGAAYFFLKPKIRSKNQKNIEQSILNQVDSRFNKTEIIDSDNNTLDLPVSISVDPNINKVAGEAYENFDANAEIKKPIYDEYGNVIINFIGSLTIPKIELTTPVADNDSLIAIRYGVGHRAESTAIGENGRALIFGHWFQEYGRVFNRLEEIKIGDDFVIDIIEDRTRYHYQVHDVKSISHESLYARLFDDPVSVESEVVLVTCIVRNNAWWTPSGRYLVYGQLVDSEYFP